ncbi:hypothetical protein B9Z55_022290 [Caenorhabditis nigoni]|uniref:Uncharacterized protein n=1 Tax=Caenorhabditis nigoni TaxID=1611254 RepID=A0A2G5SJP6_9PELO|nr:hypothetical protein B9Z55_022290 [Caenorhabditis nigoni]
MIQNERCLSVCSYTFRGQFEVDNEYVFWKLNKTLQGVLLIQKLIMTSIVSFIRRQLQPYDDNTIPTITHFRILCV